MHHAPGSVELYRKKEPIGERLGRYTNTLILGGRERTDEDGLSSMRPDKYDVDEYTERLGAAIAGVIQEQGEMPDELYNVASDAVTYLNEVKLPRKTHVYDFVTNDPRGVESVGTLRAITHNPAFIENPSRAAGILTIMSESVESQISSDLFAHYDRNGHDTLNEGYSEASLPAFEALVAEDTLWKKREGEDMSGLKASGALISMARALNIMARESPIETFDTRLTMLTRNSNEVIDAQVDQTLIDSFQTSKQIEKLIELAKDENMPEVKKRVIAVILRSAQSWRSADGAM